MRILILTLGNSASRDTEGGDCKDRILDVVGFYDALPDIGYLRPLYTYNDSAYMEVCDYSNIAASASSSQCDLVRKAMEFEQYGVFTNLSRVPLSSTYVRNRILMATGTRDHAVCTMVGIAKECDLNSISGNPETCHYITVAPVWHSLRRETAYWASKYDAMDLHAPISKQGVCLSSLHQLDSDPSTEPPHPHSAALRYTDEVPIYDGRREAIPFTSSAADFKHLEGWARYENDEVPDDAIVLVGYTVTHRGANWPQRNQISCNIQFVVVLVE